MCAWVAASTGAALACAARGPAAEPALGEPGSDPYGRFAHTRKARREREPTAEAQRDRDPAESTPAASSRPAPSDPTPSDPDEPGRATTQAARTAPAGTDPDSVRGVRFGRYRALVIGNDGYSEFPPLETAGRDAEAVARLLREAYGFEVELLREATRDDVMTALSRQRRELEEADNLLIYYAGHGWNDEDAGEAYWLPIDARPDDQTAWISNSTITQMIRAMRARHVLVVADSCYSGTLTRGVAIRSGRSGDSTRLSRLVGRRSRTALTSGGNEPVADAGSDGHSVFAGALLGALETNRRVIDATELYVDLRRRVMLDSLQTPQYGDIRMAGHEDGEFFFVPRRAPPPKPR